MVKKKKSATPATVLARFLARFIDCLLFVLPLAFVIAAFFIDTVSFLIAMDLPGATVADVSRSSPVVLVVALLGMCGYLIVQAYFLATRGQSIGKIIVKIRIVDAHTGASGGFLQNVFLREMLNALLSMIPFYFLVDSAFILQNDRRCIHDHIAGTVVVDV